MSTDIQTMLDTLTGVTFEVPSAKHDIKIPCRDLPQATLTALIKAATSAGRDEIAKTRDEIVAAIQQIPTDKEQVGAADIERVLNLAAPLLSRLVMIMPELTHRFLKDVIVGATDELVDALDIHDTTQILADTLDRVEIDTIAENLRKVFIKATTVWTTVRTRQEEAKTKEVEAQPSPPPEALQESQDCYQA